MNRLNQQRLIALRMERGLAIRQLARDSGIEIAVLNRLETSADPTLTQLSVAALTRLADRLGVSVALLFTDDASRPQPATGSADAATIGALLTALGNATAVVALVDALGWTTDRLNDAEAALNLTLRTVGMTVYRNSGHLSIRPIDDTHTTAELAVRRHPRAKSAQRLLRASRVKIVYRAAHSPISPHSLSNADRIDIATLLKAGILVENADRCYVPVNDVNLSLNPGPPDHPRTITDAN